MLHLNVFFKTYLLTIFLLFTNVAQVHAQTSTLDQTLYYSGFDRVTSSISNKKLHLSLENNYWRSDAKAMYEILEVIDESVIRTDSVHIHLISDRLFLLSVDMERAEIRKLRRGEISYQTWANNILVTTGGSRSFGSQPISREFVTPLLEIGISPDIN